MKKEIKTACPAPLLSGRLFLWGLGRMRWWLLGLIAVCMGLSVLSSFLVNPPELAALSAERRNVASVFIRADEIAPALGLVPLVSPLLLLPLFSFLRKREEADRALSMPASRITLFFSLWAADAAALALLTLTTGTASLLYCLLTPYLTPVIGDWVRMLGLGFLASLLTSALMLVVLMLTGTVPAGVLSYTSAVVLPPALSGAAYRLALDTWTLGWFEQRTVTPLLYPDWFLPSYLWEHTFRNVPWMLTRKTQSALLINVYPKVGSVLSPYYFDYDLPGVPLCAVVGALIGTVILTGTACLLFLRRRAECAGLPTVTPAARHILRVVVALPLVLLGTGLISTGKSEVYPVVCFLLAVSVFLLFELLTNRSLRAWKPLCVTLLVLPLCGGLLYGGIAATNAVVLHTALDPDDVSAVWVPDLAPASGMNTALCSSSVIRANRTTDRTVIGSCTALLDANSDNPGASHYMYADATVDVVFLMKDGRLLFRSLDVPSTDEWQARAAEMYVRAAAEPLVHDELRALMPINFTVYDHVDRAPAGTFETDEADPGSILLSGFCCEGSPEAAELQSILSAELRALPDDTLTALIIRSSHNAFRCRTLDINRSTQFTIELETADDRRLNLYFEADELPQTAAWIEKHVDE